MKTICILIIFSLSGNLLMGQWTKLPPFTSNNLTDVGFSGLDTGLAVGERGSVFKTTDGGRSWEFISPDKDITYTSVALTSPVDFYISGYKNFSDGSGVTELFATTDAGQSWQVINSYDVVGERSQVRCEGDNIYFLGGWKGLQKSTDRGLNWEMLFKGGGTTVLTNLKTDPVNPESIFIFGTIGGFATYGSMFRHSLNGSEWDLPDPFDFGNTSAYTAFDFYGDTVILFRNFYKGFMPNDTSNILSVAYDFVRDDIIPGGATGDTAWHFNIRTVNAKIPHYVNDCKFLSLTGLGFSVENVGGINRTTDGGKSWSQQYEGRDPLNAICMVSDTSGYVVGENGTVVKLGYIPSSAPKYSDNDLNVRIFPSPATDRITIERKDPSGWATLIIRNESGQEVITKQFNGSREQIDIGTWPSGAYFVTVRQGSKITVSKIIRE